MNVSYRLECVDGAGKPHTIDAFELSDAEQQAQAWYDEHKTRPALFHKLGDKWVHWRYRLEHEREPLQLEIVAPPPSEIEVARVMPANLHDEQRFFSLTPGRQTMILFSEGPLPSGKDHRGRNLPAFRPGREPKGWPYRLKAPNHAGWLYGYDEGGYYAESTDGKSWRQITKQAYDKAVKEDTKQEKIA